MKYSEIRDWVINHVENCSKEDVVNLYKGHHGMKVNETSIKYSEIRDWLIDFVEHCSKEDIVELYDILSKIINLSELILAPITVDVEWDE